MNIEFYFSILREGVKANTLDNIHTVVHPALQLAVRDGLIVNNPSDSAMTEIKRSKLWDSDIQTNSHLQRFIEDGAIPKDAVVVGKTWKYVNKSGGPDKRFKDNRELPICQYGEIELSSTSGLNTVLMFSKIDLS